MKFFILLQRVIFGYILRNKFDGKSFYRSCSPMAMTTMSYQFGFQKILQNQFKFKNNSINRKYYNRNFLNLFHSRNWKFKLNLGHYFFVQNK